MGMIERILVWLTAFAIVFSLYGHTFVGREAIQITPIVAGLIAVGLGLISACWLVRPELSMPVGPWRRAAAFVFFAAWLAFVTVGLLGFAEREPSANDWGLFLLQVGSPVLLLLNNSREGLLRALGWICVGFALADAVANFADLAGLIHLQGHGGRYTDEGTIDRLPGLTGNSHASGLVAFAAITFVCQRVNRTWTWRRLAIAAFGLVFIASSLWLIDARRYVLEAVIATVLLGAGAWRVLPLQLVAPVTGLMGVIFTFTQYDYDNDLRANLMAAGWRDASRYYLTGEGVIYRAPGLGPDFNDLWTARVTESGVLDLAISYGWPATILFLASILIALCAGRRALFWPAAILTVMGGEMAYGNPLDGFLGATVFFASLLFVICDEGRLTTVPQPAPTPGQARWRREQDFRTPQPG